MATYFYARVSTKQQDPRSQIEDARARGIPTKNIVVEVASGAKNDRPELAKLLARLQEGDVLVTFKLDRLARSLHHLLTVLQDLDKRGIGFETLDGVSTRGPHGRLTLNVLGAVAQFEKELMLERTMAGLRAAKAEGRTGGRRRKLKPQDLEQARRRMAEGLKAREVARIYRVSERSLWRNLRWAADIEALKGNGR
jgi:DNA invertase Pin-like site-specific DNA recombinase